MKVSNQIKACNKSNECPLVTIGIPTYNGGLALKKAVASISAQSYPSLEILISDNASTDDTPMVCEELLKRNSQIRYFRQKQNIGMLSNFEYLLNQAHGKYFMWLADDDALAPEVLSRYVNFLEENPDYSLVSGKINYWMDGKLQDQEEGFNFNQRSPIVRVLQYYFMVVHGAMYHGLMRTKLAQEIKIRKVIGNDWHFVASLAFMGKIKNLKFVGYHKTLGGSSRNFKQYARLVSDSDFAANFPRIKIALDAYQEIMHRSDIYISLSAHSRFVLASCSFLAILISYYAKLYPLILGGKLKRLVKSN